MFTKDKISTITHYHVHFHPSSWWRRAYDEVVIHCKDSPDIVYKFKRIRQVSDYNTVTYVPAPGYAELLTQLKLHVSNTFD